MTRRRLVHLDPLKSKQSQFVVAFVLLMLPILATMQGLWIVRNEARFRPFLLQLKVDRVLCDYCGGTGVVRQKDHPEQVDICPICFGVGGHHIRKFDKQDVLCPACTGMGRFVDPQTEQVRQCQRCGGRGVIRVAR